MENLSTESVGIVITTEELVDFGRRAREIHQSICSTMVSLGVDWLT